MEVFEERFTVPAAGLGTGDLFRLMQKISGDHCRQIGYGEEIMEGLGLMWVIIRHGVELRRWPAPGETLRLRFTKPLHALQVTDATRMEGRRNLRDQRPWILCLALCSLTELTDVLCE